MAIENLQSQICNLKSAICTRALLVAFLAGCSGLNHNTTGAGATVDPLLGGTPVKPAAAPAPAAQPAQGSGPAAAILPVPTPSSSPASTAALAAGMTRPFDKDHDLRITNPDANPGSEGWARQGTQATPANGNGSGAVLSGIVPVSDPKPNQIPVNNPAPIASPAAGAAAAGASVNVRINSYEEAETLLAARGVLWHGLDMLADTGEWRFTCIVPNKQKPGSRRTYEARDRNKLAAVQAVIDQIDREQQ